MITPKCQVCHDSRPDWVLTCGRCGTSYNYCNACKNRRPEKCSSCGNYANWEITSYTQYGGQTETTTITTEILTQADYWRQNKENREKKRAEDGLSIHRGVELVEDEVKAIRELEDLIEAPLEPTEKKAYYVIIENKHVIEIGIHGLTIEGEMLAPVAKFKNLKALRISRDASHGVILNISDKITECGSLEAVVIDGASLQKLPTLPKTVKKLKINGWDLHKPFAQLSDVLKLEQLEELNLQHSILDFKVFADGIGNLKNLKKLSLANTKGLGKFPDTFLKLDKLEELDISGADVVSSGMVGWPKWFENMKSLKLVHGKKDQVGGLSFGNVRKILEKNNPIIYPKLGLKDKIKAGVVAAASQASGPPSEAEKRWRESLPEPLRKGWSGIV